MNDDFPKAMIWFIIGLTIEKIIVAVIIVAALLWS